MTPKEVYNFIDERAEEHTLTSPWFLRRLELFSMRWVQPWLACHGELERAEVQAAYGACLDSNWRVSPVCKLLSALDLAPDVLLRLCDPDALVPYFAVRGGMLWGDVRHHPPGVLLSAAEVIALGANPSEYFRCAYRADLEAYVAIDATEVEHHS